MLVSPTESAAMRALGTVSWKAEDWGADVFWVSRKRTWGVQRKALKDLVASVDDGRLAKELLQMSSLDVAILMLETGERGGGGPREMPNGQLAGLGGYGRPWTGKQLRGVLWGVADRGVRIELTRDEGETIRRVLELEAWSRKERHESARGRGMAPVDVFGKRGNREYATFILQGLPGIGLQTAGAIYDHFKGMPLQWACTREELLKVPGVGKITAQRVWDVFNAIERSDSGRK